MLENRHRSFWPLRLFKKQRDAIGAFGIGQCSDSADDIFEFAVVADVASGIAEHYNSVPDGRQHGGEEQEDRMRASKTCEPWRQSKRRKESEHEHCGVQPCI